MSELRTRMVRDLAVRGLAPRAQKAPIQITSDEDQTYLAHLIHKRQPLVAKPAELPVEQPRCSIW